MNYNIFNGIITALITPLKEGEVDFTALELLIKRQILSRISGIVVGGSTGEGNSLTSDQYFKLIEAAITYADNKINVIAGVTAISTREAIDKLKKLMALDIDGIMCTAPPYIKPEQEGLIEHFKFIHSQTRVPLMLYIHPGRTGCDFLDDTILTIMELDRFVAIKDASADLEKPLRILAKSSIELLTGNDSAILSYYANGGVGCVSVCSNIFPNLFNKIDSSWRAGHIKKSLVIQRGLMPLYEVVFSISNPIGVKYAMYKLGLCSQELLLPLTPASQDIKNNIDIELEKLMDLENNV